MAHGPGGAASRAGDAAAADAKAAGKGDDVVKAAGKGSGSGGGGDGGGGGGEKPPPEDKPLEEKTGEPYKGPEKPKVGQNNHVLEDEGGGAVKKGSLSGTPARIKPQNDAETNRSLMRENESAVILSDNGHDVFQGPKVPGDKNPDYLIDGEIFDNYAPISSSVKNVATNMKQKVDVEQADNLVVNLSDSYVTPQVLQKQLDDWPIQGLKRVIVIDKSKNISELTIK